MYILTIVHRNVTLRKVNSMLIDNGPSELIVEKKYSISFQIMVMTKLPPMSQMSFRLKSIENIKQSQPATKPGLKPSVNATVHKNPTGNVRNAVTGKQNGGLVKQVQRVKSSTVKNNSPSML